MMRRSRSEVPKIYWRPPLDTSSSRRQAEYSVAQGFPATLVQAAATRGIAIPPTSMIDLLDRDATRGLQQALILAAIAINRLRNSEGTGHGRPHATKVERVQGRLAAETAAAVCYLLLPDSIN